MLLKRSVFTIWIFLFLLILSNPVSAEINVTLDSPQNGYIFNATSNVTFICNVSGDYDILYTILYTNISGNFEKTDDNYAKGMQSESGSVLLFHFNNDSFMGENESYVYDWSGNGNGGNSSNAVYNSTGGKFFGGYEFDYWEDNPVLVSDSDVLDLTTEGSIELWVKFKDYNIYNYQGIIWKGDNVTDDSRVSYVIQERSNKFNVLFGDGSTYDESIYSTNTVVDDKWYHLVLTWKNVSDSSINVSLYIDGVLNTSSVINIIPYVSQGPLLIGMEETWDNGFNGAIDEVVLYNRVLTPQEISEHYNLNPVLSKNVSINWTSNNLADGSYKWICNAYDNQSNSSFAVANYTFHVDISTPPNISSVSISPSSEDDIDPDTTINVTANITDISGVDTALFQYKRSGISTWNNVTMNNISLVEWNASFTLPLPPDIWDYRVFSNDTLGHSIYSQQYNVSSDYDYSWNVTPKDLGESYIFLNTNGSVGVIIINNTGDYPLNFNISLNFTNTYFNISNYENLDISAKAIEYININVTAPSEPGLYHIVITVNTTTSNADPHERNVNAVVISYWGGSYLIADIVDYENIVYQSSTEINYSAKVRNIGNETATDVWINWTLPTGWTNTSGNLSYYVGNISNGSVAWNNITISISSDASAGISYLYVNANSSNNSTANASVQVSVSCNNTDGVCGTGCSYVTDDDCSPPGGGTGGPATVYPSLTKDYEIVLDIPSRLDINRGETKTLKIGVKNPVSGTELNNIYLFLSGYPQTFVSVSPSYLTGIKYDEMKYFEVEIKAPVYAVYKEYEMNVTVKGEFLEVEKTTSSEETGKILLVTQKFVENETLGYFESAKESLQEMNESGFETKRISEMLEEIEEALEKGNYDKVKELSEDVIEIKDLALELNEQIEEMGKNIENLKQQNVNLLETEKMFFLAKSAFQRGEYDRAEERMSNALLMYNMEIVNAGFWILIYNYWWLISAVLIVSSAGAVMMKKRLIIKSIKKGLDSLVEDEKTIMNLIIKLQEEHFLERKIGLEEYQNTMGNYEKYIEGMGERRIEMISKLVGMLKFSKAMEKLKEEERRVENRIKELQKDYFELGKIGKRYYENLVGSLKNEMMEIRKMIDMMGSEWNV